MKLQSHALRVCRQRESGKFAQVLQQRFALFKGKNHCRRANFCQLDAEATELEIDFGLGPLQDHR